MSSNNKSNSPAGPAKTKTTKRTPAQTEASRRTGAKSRGPVTAEGKARAAQNALRHGLTAEGTTILVRDENEAKLEQLRLAYYTQFQPSNPVEIDLVDEMIAARWRIRRYTQVESRLLELEILSLAESNAQNWDGLDPSYEAAIAFKSLADNSNALQLLQRYLPALERTYRRALQPLRDLRATPTRETRQPVAVLPYTLPPEMLKDNDIPVFRQNNETNLAPPPKSPPGLLRKPAA